MVVNGDLMVIHGDLMVIFSLDSCVVPRPEIGLHCCLLVLFFVY